jgi:hypothetical protein
MKHALKLVSAFALSLSLGASIVAASTPTFLCQEPGGKRLVKISGDDIQRVSSDNIELYIRGRDILTNIHDPAILVVDDNDVRHSATGVKLAVFDGEDIRHGTGGKVLIHYHHPALSPDFQGDRIYSIEGEALSKQQLVAALYLLKPEMFKLTDEETAAQQKAMKEAEAEAEAAAAADQVAGKWMVLNGNGPVEKIGSGSIVVAPKKGDAYSVTLDHSKNGGPQWSGVGVYSDKGGDKQFWVAYGTPKTIGLCVYDIKGDTLEGKWYPWYIDGDVKNVGTETIKGADDKLDGDYTIVSAKSPTTGAPYAGTVSIHPTTIVGSDDNTKPYLITWTMGTIKINGIGIRTKNRLFVASGSGADVLIAKYIIHNGSMTCDFYKLGAKEMGSSASTQN